MKDSKFSFEFWENGNNGCPVIDYIEGLKKEEEDIILDKLILYEKFGLKACLNSGKIKDLAGKELEGLFEVVIKDFRIFGYLEENSMVLTHAFRKKGNKTPKAEINTALSRMP